jgi:hypothetical protein
MAISKRIIRVVLLAAAAHPAGRHTEPTAGTAGSYQPAGRSEILRLSADA